MSGRYLLDTNIVIALFAGEPSVRRHLELNADLFLPSVVIGELYCGARASSRQVVNLQRIDDLVIASDVLVCDAQTARRYGDVKNGLREKGRPIPENDVWIATIALQHGLVLVSRDTHFDEVSGLVRENW
jgi:tRNA(fMet)-specific endonuclease VapC